MPGTSGSDGSIIIDTKLDTKGFEKGSSELLNAINSLSKEVNQLGKTLQSTFSNYGKTAENSDGKVQQLESTIEQLEAKVRDLNSQIEELEAQLDSVGSHDVVDPDDLVDTGNAENQVSQLQERIAQLEAVVSDLQSQLAEAGSQSLTPEIDTTQPKQAVSSLDKEISKLESSVDKMGKSADAAIDGDTDALEKFDTQAEEVQDTIDALRQKVQQFGDAEFETDDYKWVQAEIEKADNALQRLLDRQNKMQAMGTKPNSKAWRSLEYDISRAEERLNDLLATKQIYEQSGNATVKGVDTSQFSSYTAALDAVEARLAGMRGSVDAALNPPPAVRWNSMITMSGMLRNAFLSLGQTITSAVSRAGAALTTLGTAIAHPLQTLDRMLGAVANGAMRAASALASIVRGAVSGAISRIAAAAKSAAQALAGMASKAISSGLKRIASGAASAARSILSLGMSQRQTNAGFKGGLFTILRYGLSIQTLYSLVHRLRTVLVSGFQNLAQYSSSTNAAISSVMTALGRLKNSLATAFAPIVTAVAPALTYLINLLADAMTYISAFIAALTGQSTYTRAVAVQKDYAASLGGSASAAGDAADATEAAGNAAEEASKQMAGFDELQILSDDSSSGGGGGGGSGGGGGGGGIGSSTGSMFETVPIDSAITDFVDRIKDAFANGDYEEIGRIIGEGINSAFQTIHDFISWDNLGATLTKYIDAFCRIFNSLVDTIDWDLIGSTIAEGVNTIVNSAFLLLTGIDWEAIGNAIATGLNAAIRDIDWDKLGATIGEYFTARLSVLHGAITNFDWSAAGKALGNSINGIANHVDWAKLGDTLSRSLIGAFDFLSSAIQSVDWYQLGKDVQTMLVNIDWGGICSAMFEAIGSALGGLAAFVWGVIEDAWNSVIDWWYDAAYEDGEFTIQGLLEGIWNAVCGIGEWIVTNIVDPFIEGFKKAFGIHSPSTVMADLGGYLISGLFNGILAALGDLGQWIKTNILTPIQDAFKNIGATLEVAVSLAKKGWETISGFVGTAVSVTVSLLKKGWEAISGFVGTAVSVTVSLLKKGWETISGFVGTAVSVVVSLAKKGWETVKGFVGTTVSVAVSLAKNGWNTLKGFVGSAVSVAISLAKSGWSSIKGFVGSAVSVTVSLLKKGWSTVKGFVGSAVSVTVSLLKKGWTTASRFIGSAVSVGVSLFKKGWKTISGFVGNTVSVGVSLVKKGWTKLKSFFGLSSGGTVAANGGVKLFASGGKIARSGRANWWNSVQKYASGTSSAHGTMFVAGEAGPEIVGHVNGHTEVLNQSQIAAAIYSAVVAGMTEAVNALGKYLAQHMTLCANGIISSVLACTNFTAPIPVRMSVGSIEGFGATLLGQLSSLTGSVTYATPVVSTGTVVPYEITAQQNQSMAALMQAIDSLNDELGSVIIQAIAGQTASLVAALQQTGNTTVNLDANSLTNAVIKEINRRTRMLGSSPLIG